MTCPGGRTKQSSVARTRDSQPSRMFRFPAAVSAACPLRPQCVKNKGGRPLMIHPQEALLQQVRAYEATDEFRENVIRPQVVEHRTARLTQLGVRKSRFFGHRKTEFQPLMAAATANLTLSWGGSLPADGETSAEGHEDNADSGRGLSSSLPRALGGLLRAFTAFPSASRSPTPRCRPVPAAGCLRHRLSHQRPPARRKAGFSARFAGLV